MKILVLGATGFVGRNVAEWFAAKGHEVVKHGNARKADIQADLLQPKAVDYRGFDVVIQCAAATSGCKDTLQDPALHIANNAVMNSYILKECAQSEVKHVIFPSCSVMCESKPFAQKESDWDASVPLNPAYMGFASTKIYCEKLCEFYAGISDTRFTVFRNTNFFGKYDKYDLNHSHFMGATITKVMQATDHITLWGDGQERRDFLPIREFCCITEAAIANQRTKFELFNCGSGIAMKIQEAAEKIVAVSGKDLRIDYDTSQPTIKTALSLDCSKAKELIGWEPKFSFGEGLHETLAWYKQNLMV